MGYHIGAFIRINRVLVAVLASVVVGTLLVYNSTQEFESIFAVASTGVKGAGAAKVRLNSTPESFSVQRNFKFVEESSCHNGCTFWVVADPDRNSSREGGKYYESTLLEGSLIDAADGWTVEWLNEYTLTSPYNEGGRGMELSELTLWGTNLYTFDDRTGIVFEIIPRSAGTMDLMPRYILPEGDGLNSTKGMKIEWATVKDKDMWIGSFGKEFTNNKGVTLNHWNEWVVAIDTKDRIHRRDWESIYMGMRKMTMSEPPGYHIHEAIEWSSVHRKWIAIPRRVSTTAYNEVDDNMRGDNLMFICNEPFSDCKLKRIGDEVVDRKRGYSSFDFVPGSQHNLIFAILSEERDQVTNEGGQYSFFHVFDIDGNEVVPQTELPLAQKFEGVAFANLLQ